MAKGIHGWVREEVALLRRLADRLTPPAEIASRLRRPLDEVERKAAAEDIPLHRPAIKKPVKLADL